MGSSSKTLGEVQMSRDIQRSEAGSLIETYIAAYNNFDLEGMMAVLHPRVEFVYISEGKQMASASGKKEFQKLAEQTQSMFSERRQTPLNFSKTRDGIEIELEYYGVLAMDLPDGSACGQTLSFHGRSQFLFKEGKISHIKDIK